MHHIIIIIAFLWHLVENMILLANPLGNYKYTI